MTSVFWFRRDARLDDNPGLAAAAEGGRVVPLFVIDPHLFDSASDRRRRLLLTGLTGLDRELEERGGRLRVEVGDPLDVLPRIARDLQVHVSAEVTPYGKRRDAMSAESVDVVAHSGVYAQPPGSILTAQGEPYRVFTPFFKRWSERSSLPVELPKGASFTNEVGTGIPRTESTTIAAGPAAAADRLAEFFEGADDYADMHDRIDLDSSSRLSVDLKYGWIGPRRVISAVGTGTSGRQAFVRQMAWRDFYGHVLDSHPDMTDRSLDARYRSIEWRNDPDDIEAWKRGRTGYPLVDAAMRRLVAEGLMHNRARLIVASFLVKDLLVDWRIGEKFFRHHLADGDVASNAGNWQWVAGTGTDAAPYFRVFNPVKQSKKFDPRGAFIRRWVPELANFSDESIHEPWEAGPLGAMANGVSLGVDYPEPIVDHLMARERAIRAYETARGSR